MERKAGFAVVGVVTILAGTALAFGLQFAFRAAEPSGESSDTNEGNLGVEEQQSVDSAALLEQTIANRPQPGTPEFNAVYETYFIEGDTAEEVLTSYGRNYYNVFQAAIRDIPPSYYRDNLGLTLDEIYQNTDPEYWLEIYSFATFNAASTNLSPEQAQQLSDYSIQLEKVLKQYLTTATDDNPTNYDPNNFTNERIVTSDYVLIGATDAVVGGTYSATVNPNHDNSLSELRPEETMPTTVNLPGVFQRNEGGHWSWVFIG